MNEIKIIPVRSKKERRQFIKMVWPLYLNDNHWVAPVIADQKVFLDPDRGVFFDHGEAELFMALRNNRIVGRISAHVNFLYDRLYNNEKGFFGFFECENRQDTAEALFQAASEYLRSKGRKKIEGPLSFSIYDEIGILVDGFDSDPYVLLTHNPPYYQQLITNAGLEKEIDWYAYRGYTDSPLNEKLFRARDRVIKTQGFRLRNMDMKYADRERRILKDIFDSAWNKNWGHVPWTKREYKRLVHEVTRMAIPELSYFAEVNGEPVGFALSIYDANQAVKKINGRLFPFGFIKLLTNLKKTDRFRQILMGVKEEYRNRGIEITFYTRFAEKAHKLGFKEVEMSLIVENNTAMRSSLKHLPVDIYKTYRIYSKGIS